MTIIKQRDEANNQVKCAIEALNESQTELEAEKTVAHAKGYISGLRYNQLIEHPDFKSMDSALDKALSDWHLKHDKL